MTTTPEALSLVDDNDAGTDGFARVTSDGIQITGGWTTHDFGWGVVPLFEASGRSDQGYAEVVVPYEPTPLLADELEVISWASSGVFVVAIATGESVVSVRVSGTAGSVDETVPTGERVVIAAVRAASVAEVAVEARDADGSIIATCAEDDDFIVCS